MKLLLTVAHGGFPTRWNRYGPAHAGAEVTAVVKASDVILATD
jgi:hypothetical protein